MSVAGLKSQGCQNNCESSGDWEVAREKFLGKSGVLQLQGLMVDFAVG